MSLSQPPALAARSPALLSAARTGLSALKTWLADGSDHTRAQRNAGAAFLIRLASAAIAYFSQALLARWMGSFEFGVYIYVWTWVLVIGGVASVGLETAAQRLIPEYGSESKAKLRGFLSGSRWLAMGVATLIALAGVLGILLFEPWLNHYEVVPLYLACICVPLFAVTSVQDGIARSYNWVNLGLVPPFIIRPVLIIVVMIAAHLADFNSDASTAMTAAIVATWATAIIQLIVLNRRLARDVGAGPKSYDAAAWMRTSAPMLTVACFYLILSYADVLVLQYFRTPEEVAYYYAASKTLALVAFANYSVSAVTGHKFAEYHVAGDTTQLQSFFTQAIRWTFWPSLAATILILAAGKPLLWLFGPKFVDGYPLMFILCLGLLARSAIGPAERLLNMLNEQRTCALVYAATAAVSLSLCLTLIPSFGVYGAAGATALALIFESVLMILALKRRLGFHVFPWKRDAA